MFLQIRMHIFDFVGGGRNSRKIGLYLFCRSSRICSGEVSAAEGVEVKESPEAASISPAENENIPEGVPVSALDIGRNTSFAKVGVAVLLPISFVARERSV